MTDTGAPAFFEPTEEGFVPRPHAWSPWSRQLLHGRLLGGLGAMVVERDHGGEGLVTARLTVDLYRPTPLERIGVTTRVVRSGRRMRLVDVQLTCQDHEVARVSALLLRPGPHPAGQAPYCQPPWSVPGPDELPVPGDDPDRFPVDMRLVNGSGLFGAEATEGWVRETNPLVDGVELSPLVRTALAADLASPLSNAGPGGLPWINADYTVYLGRLPEGEWIGLAATDHLGGDGVAVGRCRLYDTSGPIGSAAVAALAVGGLDPNGS